MLFIVSHKICVCTKFKVDTFNFISVIDRQTDYDALTRDKKLCCNVSNQHTILDNRILPTFDGGGKYANF